MTSAWSPKRLPESLLHYMRTRGPKKVIFASDRPVLKRDHVVPEARALKLPAEVLEEYLHDGAEELSSPASANLRDLMLLCASQLRQNRDWTRAVLNPDQS